MKRLFTILTTLFIALALCGNVSEAKTKDLNKLEVHFIDVGQGDATLIKCGDAAMLIDAAENDKGTLVQNYLKKQGIKSLDYLIITHQDSDHSGGADVIITKYDVGTIIYPNYEKDTKTWRDVIKAMDYKRYKVTNPVVGDTYKLNDAKFTIIAPNSEYDDTNNNSVGILLEHGNKKFIFTGDAEEDAEDDIVSNKIKISADVLQVGHHGSKTASTETFIKKVAPKYAVISCGENNEYGHPHSSALNNLRSNNVKLFRTDEQGSIIATSDGKKITWNAAPTTTWIAGEPKGTSNTNNKTSVIESDNTNKQESTQVYEEQKQNVQQDTKNISYILNTKTKKFHRSSCGSLPTTNRSDSSLSREDIISNGYAPCKKCNP